MNGSTLTRNRRIASFLIWLSLAVFSACTNNQTVPPLKEPKPNRVRRSNRVRKARKYCLPIQAAMLS